MEEKKVVEIAVRVLIKRKISSSILVMSSTKFEPLLKLREFDWCFIGKHSFWLFLKSFIGFLEEINFIAL
jgi:hypothetical protein